MTSIITLVSQDFAAVGREFDYMGPDPLCEDCRIRTICFNLEKGARYRIVKLRDTYHDCQATEAKVRVAEVERTERTISVESAGAIDGQTVTMTVPRCHNIGCASYRLCHPYGIDGGDKVTLVGIEGKIECPIGKNRSKVTIR